MKRKQCQPRSKASERGYIRFLTFFQVRFRSLDQEEGSLDVNEEMVIKVLLIDLAQRLQSHNPSIQNQNVDPSKRLEGLVQEVFARVHGGDVSLDRDRCTAADGIDLVGDLFRGCFVGSIVYDDRGTVLSQTLNDGGTDGPGRAGNERPR